MKLKQSGPPSITAVRSGTSYLNFNVIMGRSLNFKKIFKQDRSTNSFQRYSQFTRQQIPIRNLIGTQRMYNCT